MLWQAVGWGAQRYPSIAPHEVDGYRFAPPILRIGVAAVPSSPHERSDMRERQPKNPGYRFAHPGYFGSAQLDIQPAQRIHRNAVAGVDQHGRCFGLNNRG